MMCVTPIEGVDSASAKSPRLRSGLLKRLTLTTTGPFFREGKPNLIEERAIVRLPTLYSLSTGRCGPSKTFRSRRRHLSRMSRSGTFLLLLLFTAGYGCSRGEVVAPKVGTPILISDVHHLAMIPASVVPSGDGGFIAVGTTLGSKSAWAVKVNAVGNVLWKYSRALDPLDKYIYPPAYGPREPTPSIEYRGAAPMQDGTTYLCGSLVHNTNTIQPAMLTHIGKRGEFLDDVFLSPKDEDRPMLYWVGNCIRWGDQVVVVGGSLEPGGSRFWVFAVDKMGRRRWEARFAPLPPEDRPRAEISPDQWRRTRYGQQALDAWHGRVFIAVSPDNKALEFLASDGVNSELDSVTPEGIILQITAMFGPSYMLQEIKPTTNVILYAFSENPHVHPVIKTYDKQLNPISNDSLTAHALAGLKSLDGGFVLPDRSLALFGTSNGFGRLVTAGFTHIDAKLEDEAHTRIEVPGAELGKPGVAATLASTAGTFLVAVPVDNLSSGSSSLFRKSPGAYRNLSPGLALFFVNIK
jgi:hypothetical protein